MSTETEGPFHRKTGLELTTTPLCPSSSLQLLQPPAHSPIIVLQNSLCQYINLAKLILATIEGKIKLSPNISQNPMRYVSSISTSSLAYNYKPMATHTMFMNDLSERDLSVSFVYLIVLIANVQSCNSWFTQMSSSCEPEFLEIIYNRGMRNNNNLKKNSQRQ